MSLIRAQQVEATAGFEPASRGFADLSLTLNVRENVALRTPFLYSGRLRTVDRSVDHTERILDELVGDAFGLNGPGGHAA